MQDFVFYILKAVADHMLSAIENTAFFIEVLKILVVSVGLTGGLLFFAWKSERKRQAISL